MERRVAGHRGSRSGNSQQPYPDAPQYQQPYPDAPQYQQPYPDAPQYQQPYPDFRQYQQPYPLMPQGHGYPSHVVVNQVPSNGVGTAGFVTGLLGLIFCWVPFFGIVLGILGVILGAAGISGGRRTGAGTGLAVAGLVLGLISLVPAVIVIAALAGSSA